MVFLVQLVESRDLFLTEPGIIFPDKIYWLLVPFWPIVIAASNANIGEDKIVWKIHRIKHKRNVPRQRLCFQDEVRKVILRADSASVPAEVDSADLVLKDQRIPTSKEPSDFWSKLPSHQSYPAHFWTHWQRCSWARSPPRSSSRWSQPTSSPSSFSPAAWWRPLPPGISSLRSWTGVSTWPIGAPRDDEPKPFD